MMEARKIFLQNSKAVVVVYAYNWQGNLLSQGSGFFINSNGVLVTNWHVIYMAESIKVKMGNQILDVEGVIDMDVDIDLILLKVSIKNLYFAPLDDTAKLEVGEKVWAIGSPAGLENTISEGILSGVRFNEQGRKSIQITAPISPGSSGGPVFNENGQVIGVSTSFIQGMENLNFAVPVDWIRDRINVINETMLSVYPYLAVTSYDLDIASDNTGRWLKAIEACMQAIKLKPDLALAYNNLGSAYGNMSRWSEAVEAYRQAIMLKPDLALAYNNLGWAYGNMGRWSEAVEAYRQAIMLKPDYAGAYYNLGSAYGNMGRWSEAIEACMQAIKLKPDYAVAYNNLGCAYGDMGRWSEAVEAYRQAITLKPDLAGAYNNLGWAYDNMGRWPEAVEACMQAIKLKPDLAMAYNNLSWAYGNMGRW